MCLSMHCCLQLLGYTLIDVNLLSGKLKKYPRKRNNETEVIYHSIFCYFLTPNIFKKYRLRTVVPGAQQTQNICIASLHRRANILDVGPTLYKSYKKALCLKG